MFSTHDASSYGRGLRACRALRSSAPAGRRRRRRDHFMMAGPPPAPRRRGRTAAAARARGRRACRTGTRPTARCRSRWSRRRVAPLCAVIPSRPPPPVLTLPSARSQDSQTHMIMVTTPYGYGQSPPDYAQMAQYFASMAAQQQDQVPPGDYGRPAYYPAEPVGYKPPGAALVAKKVVEARSKPTVAARPSRPSSRRRPCCRRRSRRRSAARRRRRCTARPSSRRRRGRRRRPSRCRPCRSPRRRLLRPATRRSAAAAAAVREARQARHVWLLVQVVPAEPQRPRRHPRVTPTRSRDPPPSKTPFPGPWHLSATHRHLSLIRGPRPRIPTPPASFSAAQPPFPGRRPPMPTLPKYLPLPLAFLPAPAPPNRTRRPFRSPALSRPHGLPRGRARHRPPCCDSSCPHRPR